MPDFDDLRQHRQLVARPELRAAVIRTGVKRRRRAAGGVGAMTALAFAAAASLILPSSSGSQSLLPAEQVPLPVPTGAASEADRPLLPAPAPGPDGERSAVSGPSAAALADDPSSAPRPGGAAPLASATSSPVAGNGAAAASPYGPLTRVKIAGMFTGECVSTPEETGNPTCELDAPREGTDTGGQRALGFDSCQHEPSDGASRLLRFDAEREVALTIKDATDKVVWTWRPPQAYGDAPHREVLRPTECLTWRTPWRYVDDTGRPVARGIYVLFVDYLEVGSSAEFRTTFTY